MTTFGPAHCGTCGTRILGKYYYGKIDDGTFEVHLHLHRGHWEVMCPSCFHLGPGLGKLGMGFGQEYTKQTNGEWKKTGG